MGNEHDTAFCCIIRMLSLIGYKTGNTHDLTAFAPHYPLPITHHGSI